jgi:hypothetical protein
MTDAANQPAERDEAYGGRRHVGLSFSGAPRVTASVDVATFVGAMPSAIVLPPWTCHKGEMIIVGGVSVP